MLGTAIGAPARSRTARSRCIDLADSLETPHIATKTAVCSPDMRFVVMLDSLNAGSHR